MRYVRFFIAPLLIPVSRLQAQQAPSLQPGIRVRVSTAPRAAGPDWRVGTLVAVTAESLAIRPQRDSGPVLELARASVTHLEVSRGQHSKSLTGLGIGFFLGTAVGVAIGQAALQGVQDLSSTDAALLGAAPGALVGGLIGLWIGSASKSERWQEIPVTLGARAFHYPLRVSVNLRFRTL